MLINLKANSKEEAKEQIDNAILNFIGVLGYAKAGVMFVLISKDKVILAVNRNQVDKVRGAFALSKFKIKVVRVSGSLKKLRLGN